MTSERIKEIQQQTAYPDSISVQQALLQVWNECSQVPQQENLYTEEQMIQAIKLFINYKEVSGKDVWDKDIDLYIKTQKEKHGK
jgi:hypothetical protein